MNRRNFLGMMVGGVAAAAAVRTWPFRVYSFPSEVRPRANLRLLTMPCIPRELIELQEKYNQLAQMATGFYPRLYRASKK